MYFGCLDHQSRKCFQNSICKKENYLYMVYCFDNLWEDGVLWHIIFIPRPKILERSVYCFIEQKMCRLERTKVGGKQKRKQIAQAYSTIKVVLSFLTLKWPRHKLYFRNRSLKASWEWKWKLFFSSISIAKVISVLNTHSRRKMWQN